MRDTPGGRVHLMVARRRARIMHRRAAKPCLCTSLPGLLAGAPPHTHTHFPLRWAQVHKEAEHRELVLELASRAAAARDRLAAEQRYAAEAEERQGAALADLEEVRALPSCSFLLWVPISFGEGVLSSLVSGLGIWSGLVVRPHSVTQGSALP
jgi:hypothetical protein